MKDRKKQVEDHRGPHAPRTGQPFTLDFFFDILDNAPIYSIIKWKDNYGRKNY